MTLSTSDLIKLLRESVYVQDPNNVEEIDPNYLAMTDDDLLLFIKLGVTRAYPEVDDLEDLPDGSDWAVILLAKVELYLKLAVMVSPKVDMGADGAYLKLDQRYQHYMELSKEARAEYDDWLENESEGANQVNTYDVLLSKWHYTRRNYEKQVTPKVRIKVVSLTSDSVEVTWKMSNTSHFGLYAVYSSEDTIIDPFRKGMLYKDKVNESATLVKRTHNIRDNNCEITGLTADTTYHLAVFSVERNQVFGYSEIAFTTLEELNDEDV